MLDQRASAENTAPQNGPGSNSLRFQADFWLQSQFTPGMEQIFQQRVWILPIKMQPKKNRE